MTSPTPTRCAHVEGCTRPAMARVLLCAQHVLAFGDEVEEQELPSQTDVVEGTTLAVTVTSDGEVELYVAGESLYLPRAAAVRLAALITSALA